MKRTSDILPLSFATLFLILHIGIWCLSDNTINSGTERETCCNAADIPGFMPLSENLSYDASAYSYTSLIDCTGKTLVDQFRNARFLTSSSVLSEIQRPAPQYNWPRKVTDTFTCSLPGGSHSFRNIFYFLQQHRPVQSHYTLVLCRLRC